MQKKSDWNVCEGDKPKNVNRKVYGELLIFFIEDLTHVTEDLCICLLIYVYNCMYCIM